MKTKIFLIVICNLLICNLQLAQNITNTLGTLGVFKIKDGSTDYLTLNQSTGQLNILKTLRLENTTSSTTGIIFKGVDRFLHNFSPPGTFGFNTFIGINSGNFTMSGTSAEASYNTGIGYLSLNGITTGNFNTGIGTQSLLSNTTGNSNTAVGYTSLFSNTSGVLNTAVGRSSLAYNTTGNRNTAVGYSSLESNTIGNFNTAVGFQSLTNNVASDNTTVGYQSLSNNTNGYSNTAVGLNSLFNNTIGISNTAMGLNSLYNNISGNYNTALGHSSLFSNINGGLNTTLGYQSLFNTTGNYNTALGYYSGTGITTGSNNTTIGNDAQVPMGTSSNQVRIGNTSIGYAGVQVAWTITSDKRWKQNILPSSLGLSFISKLNPVSYTRKNDESGKTEYGLIAQEVEEVLKESGVENSGMITVTDEGMYELRYNDLMAPMIKAIQELKVEGEKLKTENEDLKIKNENLEERLTKIEQMQNILVNEIEKMKSKNSEVKEVKLGENKK